LRFYAAKTVGAGNTGTTLGLENENPPPAGGKSQWYSGAGENNCS
jgi:hypothetical protein